VVAAIARVLSRAVPMEVPICWPVLIMAEATPASASGTRNVAVLGYR
jgi:hypothetical protein